MKSKNYERSLLLPHVARLMQSSKSRPTSPLCSRLIIPLDYISLSASSVDRFPEHPLTTFQDTKSFTIILLLQSTLRNFLRQPWSE